MENEYKWDLKAFRRELVQLHMKTLDTNMTIEKNNQINRAIDTYDYLIKNGREYEKGILEESATDDESPEDINIGRLLRKIKLINTEDLFRIKQQFSKQIDFINPLFLDYCFQLSKGVPNIDIRNDIKLEKINISNAETFEIMKSFYQEVDKEFSDIYMNHFMDNKDVYEFRDIEKMKGDFRGMCTYDEYNRKVFIYSYQSGDIGDLYNLTHETTHGISYLFDISHNEPYLFNEYKKSLKEVDTYFMELILTDFLINKSYDKLNCYKHVLGIIQNIKDNALLLNTIVKIAKTDEKELADFNMVKKLLNQESNVFRNKDEVRRFIKGISDVYFLNNIKYMLSFFVALDLYEQYKIDKEQGLHTLKKVITYKGGNIHHFLESINIDYTSYYQLDNYKKLEKDMNNKVKVLTKKTTK